jgi:drug/metabolite transporter (DMT)-like permease
MRVGLALLLAFVSSSLYALSSSLQALEARKTPRSSALRASLLTRLVRRPLWLAGTAAGVAAWPMQAAALAFGSVALVQPALGFGLIVLLLLGVTVLHERVGPREIAGVLAILGALVVLGFSAPKETGSFTTSGSWAIGLSLILVGPAPYLLRWLGRADGLSTSLAAGIGWAWVGFGTSLLDDALGARNWVAVVFWGAGVAAATFSTVLDEMTAFQTWPATRAVPIAFGLEMLLPAALAPFVTHVLPPHPWAFAAALVVAGAGVVLLGGSKAVGRAAAGSEPLTVP